MCRQYAEPDVIDEQQWLDLSRQPDVESRWRALLCLQYDDDPACAHLFTSGLVAERVVELLDDPEPKVRHQAIMALWRIRVPASVPKLVEILQREADGPVSLTALPRVAAAHALAFQQNPDALPALRYVALDERAPLGVREECLRALGDLGDAGWLREQWGRFADAEQWQLRWALGQAAREAQMPEAALLLERLQADPEVPSDLRKRARQWRRNL